MIFIRWLLRQLFSLLGWQAVGHIPPDVSKAVAIFVPHTSNWDAFYGLMLFLIKGVPLRFAIKKELMFFPLGFILKALGAIPIDRKKTSPQDEATGAVDKIVQLFAQSKPFVLVIAPEGTRSYVEEWKTGFYHIAMQAKVPIVLGYLDYRRKQAGFGPVFYPTGNLEQDLQHFKAFYKDKVGKYPALHAN